MIEVGEWIRLKDGRIRQLKWTDGINAQWTRPFGEGLLKDIVKHSKNIIDLIEVGDIVHTRDVLNEDIVYTWSEEYLKACKEDLNNGIELVEILTKEQYKQNCYTVERKKEC